MYFAFIKIWDGDDCRYHYGEFAKEEEARLWIDCIIKSGKEYLVFEQIKLIKGENII